MKFEITSNGTGCKSRFQFLLGKYDINIEFYI